MGLTPAENNTVCKSNFMCARDVEHGGAIVEFVFVLPLIIVFLIAILHFGLQMITAEAFVGNAEMAVASIDIDSETIVTGGTPLVEKAREQVQSLSFNNLTLKDAKSKKNSSGKYKVTYTFSCKLPALFNGGKTELKRQVVREVSVSGIDDDKSNSQKDDDSKDETSTKEGK